jgi:hypothetical protein
MNKKEAKKQIDADEASINGVKLITACRAKDIIDAIDDHPKVKLPREVGEWVDMCRKDGNAQSLLNYEATPGAVDEWADAYENDGINDHFGKLLMQAYLYDWESEPEELFYVKGPKSWGYEHAWASIRNGHMSWDSYEEYGKDVGFRYAHAFTHAELKQYQLDSDIFTLVPVENEEVSR